LGNVQSDEETTTLPECSRPPVTAASSPDAIARHKASLPVRQWEVPSQRKLVPVDLQALLEMPTNIIRMSDHAWTNVQEPLPGTATNAAGDALKGKLAQHYSAREFVDALDAHLESWQWIGEAPSNKGKASEIAWEIYIAVKRSAWLVCIIARRFDGEFVIKTTYLTSDERFEQRREFRGLIKRMRR
jgi:hypothetical protein